jgi:hypothetical protein
MRRTAVATALAAALVAVGGAEAGPAEETEYAGRAAKVARADAADLKRVAEWGDRAGLERTADADWERVLALFEAAGVSGEEADGVRRRLRHVRREGAWVRDVASWALARSVPDAQPQKAPSYRALRASDFERPSARRHRDLALWCRDAGLARRTEEHLRISLDRDPEDLWAHLALGDVPDPDGEWVTEALRRRRIAAARADTIVRRLKAAGAAPVRLDERPTRPLGEGAPVLAAWRLREWRLETDLDDGAAAAALSAADLATRWFREAFAVPRDRRLLPSGGTFVVCSTADLYRRVVAARPGLSSAERTFAAGLGAFPFPRADAGEPAEVVIERPDAASAADACLHYAVHFLAQAHLGVEAQEAWLYEGLAAYAARLLGGVHGTWCVRLEETGTSTFGLEPALPERWPEIAVRLAASRDDFPMKGLVGASLNALDGAMLVKSWSVLRWLLEDRPDDACLFLDARRAGIQTARALAGATGLSLDDLDSAWRAHVLSVGAE